MSIVALQYVIMNYAFCIRGRISSRVEIETLKPFINDELQRAITIYFTT